MLYIMVYIESMNNAVTTEDTMTIADQDDTIAATIHERGNGLPEAGDYVPGDDGELYEVVTIDGRIQTGGSGRGNWVDATVRPADWDDCDEDDVFPAQAVVDIGTD